MILQLRQMSKDAQYVNITFPLVCLSVCLARSPWGYSLDFPCLRCIEQLLISDGPGVNPVNGSDPERNRIIDYSAEVDSLINATWYPR